MIPADHISTSFLYPYLRRTSGATYAGVPQLSIINSVGTTIFERPKSVIFIFVISSVSGSFSIKIFSGLRSR
jgi:hypothetical protein